jgi:hypothetical protein
MSGWRVGLLCGVVFAGWSAKGQEPIAYTLTVVNSMSGSPMEETVYRDGSRAAIDLNTPAVAGGTATHVRSLYNLTAQTNTSWDMIDSSGGCGAGKFSGDWGDPFTPLVDLSTAKLTGSEPVNGFAAKVYTADAGGGATAKLWVDVKTGLEVRIDVTQDGKTQTLTEVKKLTVGAPPAGVFVLPASCAAAAGPPPVSLRDQEIADDTGSKVGDFVDAVMTTAPGSQDSCSVVVR